MVYYSGFGLLAFTILLLIIFIVRKPTYKPENADYIESGSGTQKLRNGYSTDRMTKRVGQKSVSESTELLNDTQLLSEDLNKTADMTQPLIEDETEPLTEMLDGDEIALIK